MESQPATSSSRIIVLAILFGGVAGIVTYIVVMLCVMELAPRRAENIRQVVDLPWPVFALSPTVIAYACLLPIDLLVGRWPGRFYLIVAFSIGVAFATAGGGLGLLRRDYIGKF